MLFERVRRIKTRTWVLIGFAISLCIALAIWAVLAIIGALWGGAQSLIGNAPEALEAAKQQVTQHAQTLKGAAQEQLAQQLPQLPTPEQVKAELAKKSEALTQSARERLAQSAPEVQQAIDQATKLGADANATAEQLAAATLAATAAATAALANAKPTAEMPLERDVSGEDLGPTRYPGLIRVAWVATEASAQVRYEGRVDYAAAISHYQREFSALGFTQSVVSADQNQEVLRFNKGQEALILKIERQDKEAHAPFVRVEITRPIQG